MHPVKLSIPGRFWDSQIYAGRLYLFTIDGSIRVVNWDDLIDRHPIDQSLKLALQCAFSRSDLLYGDDLKTLFRDVEVTAVLRDKFQRLSRLQLEVPGLRGIEASIVSERANNFAFPHTDSRIYASEVYVSSQKGVWTAPCHKSLKYGIGQKPEQLWDASVLGMSVYGNALAMALGKGGLWEKQIGETSWSYSDDLRQRKTEPRLVAKNDCVNCNWTFTSVFGSSHVAGGFLAEFTVEADRDHRKKNTASDDEREFSSSAGGEQRTRVFKGIRKARDIFKQQGYSWASHDKIYQAGPHSIRFCRFHPWAEGEGEVITPWEEIQLQEWKGQVVSAGVAVFGTIIECDNAIVILGSNGENLTIPGEPVRWRVFPRSRHYENHLHILYHDRLEVWSFNHDYFVDQKEKKMGVSPYLGQKFRR